MDADAIDRLAAAVNQAFDPAGQFAEAVSAAFAESGAAQRADRALSLARADLTAAAAASKARRRALEGGPDLVAKMQARGPGLSARVWC